MRSLLALVPLLSFACAPKKLDRATVEAEATKVIDAWHEAAARADEAAYFDHFASDGVFLGTDAKERWSVAAFREYAHPHFAKGKAWTMKAHRRAIAIAPAGDVVWFDEDLDSKGLGAVRGSGVLVREQGRLKIAHYVLSVPIPNEKLAEVRKVVEAK